jgi:hypothetical protein
MVYVLVVLAADVGESVILKRYRYALIFPWPVKMVVRA